MSGQAGHDHPPRPPSSDYPATPVHGVQDPFQLESGSNKKSRTKPIRNSEGVLIRKDGRPDMRSVSSANNLRKVHAKKEAERAETEGRTPTSAAGDESHSPEERSHVHGVSEGTPASVHENQDHRNDAEGGPMRIDSQGRTRDLMNSIFPQGYDGTGRYGERGVTLGSSLGDVRLKTETLDAEGRSHDSPRAADITSQDARPALESQHTRPPEAKMTAIAESTEA